MVQNRLLIIAIALLVVLGVTTSLLGTAWPSLRLEFDRPIQDLGVLAAIGVVAGSVSSAMSGTLARRFGLARLLTLGPAMSVIGLVGFAFAQSWTALVIWSVVLSVGWGLLDPGVNSHVALEHGPRAMNLLHATFGVGAVIGPILMARSIAGLGDWRPAYVIGASLMALVAGAVVLTRSQWRAPAVSSHESAVSRPVFASTIPYLAAFLFAVAVELTIGQWSVSILEARGMSLEPAARFVASYWAGLTAGRFLGVVIGGVVSFGTTLISSAAVLAVGLIIFGADPGGNGAWALPLAGLGIALFFPTMVSVTAQGFGDETDYVVGWSFAAAGAGAGLGPWLMGEIGARAGLDSIPWLVLGVTGLLAVSAITAVRHSAIEAASEPVGLS
jgi:fucose permease